MNKADPLRRRFAAALEVPLPTGISAEAQAMLAAGQERMRAWNHDEVPPASAEEWRASVALTVAAMQPLVEQMMAGAEAAVERRTVAGVSVAWAIPQRMIHPGRLVIMIHGGGWAFYGDNYVDAYAALTATDHGCAVCAVDYRRPPDRPFPAALDDCAAVFVELAGQWGAGNIAVAGASAGGNLAAALALKLNDEGQPMPAALGLLTPVVDCTQSGDSWATNFGLDLALLRFDLHTRGIYAGGEDLRHPYLSPLYGDLSGGFPPSFLQSGTRDRLLSDTVRMHRKLVDAGIPAELHVWEAMPHGGFGMGTPEDREVRLAFCAFVNRVLADA